VAIKKISGIRDMDHIDAMRTLREIKICRWVHAQSTMFMIGSYNRHE
jgi:hypothetical protein